MNTVPGSDRRRLWGWLLVLLASLGVGTASRADAQALASASYDAERAAPLLPVRLDGHASLTWDGYFGLGARVDIPIMQKGLAYSSRDELAISVGADVIFVAFEGRNPLQVWPTAVVQWSLGVTENFSFYPELGLAGQIDNGWEGIYPNVGFGGRYYLHRSIALMARVGWPMALSLGATF